MLSLVKHSLSLYVAPCVCVCVCVCVRYWGKLPEVKQKEQEQRRESEAATNRLHMKLYQQVSQDHSPANTKTICRLSDRKFWKD